MDFNSDLRAKKKMKYNIILNCITLLGFIVKIVHSSDWAPILENVRDGDFDFQIFF